MNKRHVKVMTKVKVSYGLASGNVDGNLARHLFLFLEFCFGLGNFSKCLPRVFDLPSRQTLVLYCECFWTRILESAPFQLC
jgi:hypothetical protein